MVRSVGLAGPGRMERWRAHQGGVVPGRGSHCKPAIGRPLAVPKHIGEAMTELKENLARHPNDRETLLALVSFSRDGGDARAALEYAERLAGIAPQDSALAALIEELRRLAGKQTPK
jgi:hypothetical protein